MKTLALFLMLGALGCGRPVGESCRFGTDCQSGEWCVSNWGPPPKTPAGNVCAQECSSDAECETGCCAQVGDGVAAGTPTAMKACAPATMCH